MPPRLKGQSRFQADLKLAAEKNIANISGIGKGDCEDEFTFTYTNSNQSPESHYQIRVQPQDVHGYPTDSLFIIYTDEDVPREFAQVLDESIHEMAGMKVIDMLTKLSKQLRDTLQSNKHGSVDAAGATGTDHLEESDGSESELDLYMSDDDDTLFGNKRPIPLDQPISSSSQQRLQRDLLSVSKAGFHTGEVYTFVEDHISNIAWISTRVDKLGLSKATREAWYLTSSDYIILLIRYSRHCTSFEEAVDSAPEPCDITFRLRKSTEEKPTQRQASEPFRTKTPHQQLSSEQALPRLWIGDSIESLMDLKFLSMMRLRHSYSVTWTQTSEILHSQEGSTASVSQERFTQGATIQGDEKEDHIFSKGEISLPLVAIQFALHYLVNCTDYCTICHRELKDKFDVLKPYVCGKPLCLYQYMNLGFGPSIESEIVNQPQVVDLLVSVCYAGLTISTGRVHIREFPTGLNLTVPKIRVPSRPIPFPHPAHSAPVSSPPDWPPGNVKFGGGVILDPVAVVINERCDVATLPADHEVDVKRGQWIVVAVPLNVSLALCHARVESVEGNSLRFSVMSKHLHFRSGASGNPVVDKVGDDLPPSDERSGYLVLGGEDLDSLDNDFDKAYSMTILLAALPSVEDMRSYLMAGPDRTLALWDRIPQAATDLLRWIIASNRSHIVQVDRQAEGESLGRPPDKISGVDGWIQFRFAQGSPGSDQSFNRLSNTTNQRYKTLLAWHGSSLVNWHSIIRQGLDYQKMANGRAFGNGIYLSPSFDTSVVYCATGVSHTKSMRWPQSSLDITAILSLNEVINSPYQFVSQHPHYVVQHCHWTRCRYLFARPNDPSVIRERPAGSSSAEEGQVPEFIQDPSRIARGPKASTLFIPEAAIRNSDSARLTKTASVANKNRGNGQGDMGVHDRAGEDGASQTALTSKTDFRPGTLDYSTLPLLAAPSYATASAQKALSREISQLNKVQSNTPLHQLGWYMDFNKLDNMFQWIVELHSFDPSLPLAQDMKAKGLTGVVLEFRFLSTFPVSPPFVRVISPRFLPFAHGGGGHVTSGGAMCMEMLTNTGWSPLNSMESVIMSVRMTICSEHPPARLEQSSRLQRNSRSQYTIREAIDAYTRAAIVHGWQIPKELKKELSGP
ncbi:hypothetical protein GGR52DRAFT_42602 [Hypoxylon sp. FL1284]|nr:hypothetical protein GGR52DRAFT_42602 [Hypoxylon sp. FL1284]